MAALITVITVSYNSVCSIEDTINSVLSQNFKDCEYIIIDGKSTDGTIDVIYKYKRQIDCILTEKDSGIYDAMNKGIDKARGEWILFLNCGDVFYSSNVLKDVSNYLSNTDASVVYGDTQVIFPNDIHVILKPKSMNAMRRKLPFCHQACFLRRDVAISNLFDLNYKICADYNQFYSIYLANYQFQYIPITISKYLLTEGFSLNNEFLLLKEEFKVNAKTRKMSDYVFYGVNYSKILIRKNLPTKLVSFIRRLLYN